MAVAILSGPERRRRWTQAEKLRLVEETVAPEANIAEIARRHDVSAFKHHRKVENRHGPSTRRMAPVKKSIYSLRDLRDILLGCNRRYLAHLSALDDFSAGARALDRVTRPRLVDGKIVKPINFFNRIEQSVLRALQCPTSTIAGFRRADLMPRLTDLSPAALSRYISRLRKLGLLNRIHGTYRYYLTKIGRAGVAACSHITENVLIPALA